jgi:hypothetical protein
MIPEPVFLSLDDLPREVRQIAALSGLGYTNSQIARTLGISPQTAARVLQRYRRCLESLVPSSELAGLSARAVNVLSRHGIRTREQAWAEDLWGILVGQRNCGRKTIEEIVAWAEGIGRGD